MFKIVLQLFVDDSSRYIIIISVKHHMQNFVWKMAETDAFLEAPSGVQNGSF